jgi:hypothetical protein
MAKKVEDNYKSMIMYIKYTQKAKEFQDLLDELTDMVYNLNENVSYVRGKFGDSLELDTDDLISNVKSLADYSIDSFVPAMEKVDEYLDIERRMDSKDTIKVKIKDKGDDIQYFPTAVLEADGELEAVSLDMKDGAFISELKGKASGGSAASLLKQLKKLKREINNLAELPLTMTAHIGGFIEDPPIQTYYGVPPRIPTLDPPIQTEYGVIPYPTLQPAYGVIPAPTDPCPILVQPAYGVIPAPTDPYYIQPDYGVPYPTVQPAYGVIPAPTDPYDIQPDYGVPYPTVQPAYGVIPPRTLPDDYDVQTKYGVVCVQPTNDYDVQTKYGVVCVPTNDYNAQTKYGVVCVPTNDYNAQTRYGVTCKQ